MRLRLLLLAATLVLFAACDDPSNVGIGLVEDQGEPVVATLLPTLFTQASLDDRTGASSRILAGRVDDPLLSEISAIGYVDFTSTFDTTGAPAVTGAELRLRRNYVYGDTTSTLTFNLYDLVEDWNATRAPADTSLPFGALVTSFDVLSTDSLTTIALPDTWVSNNDTTLASNVFEEVFHGFALEATGGNAVVGFDATRSVLRVFTENDTTDFPLVRTLSGLSRTGPAMVPADRILIQDGTGPGLKVNFDFSQDSLRDTPVNGAFLRLFADSLARENTPPNFVRPLLRRLQLVAVEADSSVFLLGEATLTDEGHFIFDAPPSQDVLSLRDLVQRTFFGGDLFDHLALRVPFDNNTLNAILLYTPDAASKSPEAVLTLTPLDE